MHKLKFRAQKDTPAQPQPTKQSFLSVVSPTQMNDSTHYYELLPRGVKHLVGQCYVVKCNLAHHDNKAHSSSSSSPCLNVV
ncbi:hypothetical protein ACFX2B_013328 [Malus domestica]